MNGFEVTPGQKLRVNILTDGPTIATNHKEQDELNEEKNFIHTASARNQLMQQLMGDKDMGNLRPAPLIEVKVVPE